MEGAFSDDIAGDSSFPHSTDWDVGLVQALGDTKVGGNFSITRWKMFVRFLGNVVVVVPQ